MTIVDSERELLGGRYELQERIASGGMGEVWRGRDVRLGRSVAIKLLRSEYADDPSFTARFRAEATHAAGLSHPNIAAVHDYGETVTGSTGERVAYLVMELVDGVPLSQRFDRDGPLDPSTALDLLRQAAAALAEAHRAGVVHRDVKPANILVGRDGRVKLTDFGIAWSAASVPLTRTGQVIGTPQYMSPEQASGEAPRPASDVYALGLIGYESLSGHAAFDGDNPVTIALKQVQQEPEPLPAEVPDDVRNLIDAALTKDPDDRFPDADAFLAAIDATLDDPDGEHPATRPVALADPATLPAAAPPASRGTRGPGAGRRPRRRAALLVAVLAAALLGAGLAGAALTSSDSGGGADSTSAAPEPSEIVLAAVDHLGRPADEVADELRALGLVVDRRDRTTARYAPGTVAALEPAGSPLARGDEVRLDVAVAPVVVPGDGAPSTAAGPDAPATADGGPDGGDAPDAGPAGRPSADPGATAGTGAGADPAVPVPSAPAAPEPAPGGAPADGGPATGDPTAGGQEDQAPSGGPGATEPVTEPSTDPSTEPSAGPTTGPTAGPTAGPSTSPEPSTPDAPATAPGTSTAPGTAGEPPPAAETSGAAPTAGPSATP